ncbi:hypothetical protein RRG08_020537 [Elysia crispata]|uniref:Reverse transcriptase domain-containing protein n=1 Tax=Elysia crispata TaxID=231223 RepID=A0AAE1DBV8_9GAST|nr:hypothetical protein RRG08_020537 [Elysia crispata]
MSKTAVITPFGLWEFLQLPFGLKSAAETFQRLMDSVLQDIDSAFVFLDDILIAVDRIKPAFFDPFQPVILAKPPPHGCPPAKQSHPSRSHPSDSSNQQAMSGPAVQTSSRTGRTIRPPMRYQ